ncbi:acyltransferase [Pedobacter sp. BS3]|uniref:acyltransferase n=1 Tax=Pedobacter sp. BS3 TaxID=2567937 RepID=UPI0011EFCBA4|nr:acyltransferase [Pedobacter sp. BS3]TZF84992.1 acyltransferase [Pedobacter sp. BS3]
MTLSDVIRSNPAIKKFVHRLLIPKNGYSPRLWVKLLVNPLKHHKGKGSRISWKARTDVFPFNRFSLGNRSVIEAFSVINNGVGDVIIGDHSIIGIGDVIIGPVKIGNNVMLAQHVVLSGLNHEYRDINMPPKDQGVTTRQITIDDNVWIGANSIVTAGVHIGKHAVIGGGSVVTKDIPDHCVAAGNPAKVVKRYNFDTQSWEKVCV